ncbi:fumarylacetoacetate hydrolase family protein [soil metagenome]
MRLYNTSRGPLLDCGDRWVAGGESFDALVARGPGLIAHVRELARTAGGVTPADAGELLPPIGSQEVWGAGVTYFRSRTARMEEAGPNGAADFYERVYQAERPELFLKATPHRVVGPGQAMRLRRDSKWIVPEPELTLLISPGGHVLGYTIGNDLSCRDIEGENPLYLPQAKTYDRCAALGPGVLISESPLAADTSIDLEIHRGAALLFSGSTTVGQIRRSFADLVAYLFREAGFPAGCLLMTGTGVVPPDDLSLQPGDEARITIAPIGTLSNSME